MPKNSASNIQPATLFPSYGAAPTAGKKPKSALARFFAKRRAQGPTSTDGYSASPKSGLKGLWQKGVTASCKNIVEACTPSGAAKRVIKWGGLAYMAGMSIYGTIAAAPHIHALFIGMVGSAHFVPVAATIGAVLLAVIVGTLVYKGVKHLREGAAQKLAEQNQAAGQSTSSSASSAFSVAEDVNVWQEPKPVPSAPSVTATQPKAKAPSVVDVAEQSEGAGHDAKKGQPGIASGAVTFGDHERAAWS
jgi:hypothetical protein